MTASMTIDLPIHRHVLMRPGDVMDNLLRACCAEAAEVRNMASKMLRSLDRDVIAFNL
jgi:hypothetical protein